jgi:hypothetical protein
MIQFTPASASLTGPPVDRVVFGDPARPSLVIVLSGETQDVR